jgi:hypothetical protein
MFFREFCGFAIGALLEIPVFLGIMEINYQLAVMASNAERHLS